MNRPTLSLTAVFLRSAHGYVGFVEEVPGLNSHGQTIDEARANLRAVATEIFDLERTQTEELLRGKDVLREGFAVTLGMPPGSAPL
jgi:predicted RNase H-like HicB family nuclease